jgi:trehalose 6-phosphate phosphatase
MPADTNTQGGTQIAAPPADEPPPFDAGWAFFLDVDGTLLDHAATPGAVAVDARMRRLLDDLRRVTGGAVALVSGRAGADIDALFHPMRGPLAGQHGVERRDAAGQLHVYAVPGAGLREAARELAAMAARHPGLVFEDKGMNLAMHYRLAPTLCDSVEAAMRRLADTLGPGFEEQGGKLIWEIKPSARDKGKAVAEFTAEAPFAGRVPVFIGDDVTDESAFRSVNALGGVSIKVGPGPTQARYRLPSAEAVRRWLESWAAWMERAA